MQVYSARLLAASGFEPGAPRPAFMGRRPPRRFLQNPVTALQYYPDRNLQRGSGAADPMEVYAEIEPCRQAVLALQRCGKTVGLVPTMGALHEGHLSLLRAARGRCDRVAVTIFVNPTQFGPNEDFSAYPRPLEHDLAACRREGVDIVFTPRVEQMYPGDARTTVHVGKLTDGLCGASRSGHFDGVATIVTKLFHIIPADAAFFGEKDYQQLVVIRRFARDLNIPIEVVGCPTVRERDGLAMSSRNANLAPRDREQAVSLSRALFGARERIKRGDLEVAGIVASMREAILAAGPADIEYIEVVDSETLEPLARVDRPARILLAVKIGSCRLIDNVGVDATSKAG